MLRTREAEQLTRLWSAVGTWPRERTLGGMGLPCQPSPPRRKVASGARAAARRKSSSTRASRSGRRLPRKTTSQARVWSGGDGVVGVGVEAVVHGVVGLCGELEVARAGEGAAAVGEDGVVAGAAPGEGVGGVGAHAVDGGGGVDVPDEGHGVRRKFRGDAAFEFGVVAADAGVLDDDVGFAGEGEHAVERAAGGVGVVERAVERVGAGRGVAGLVGEGAGEGEVDGVEVLLAAVGVGLGEGDVITEAGEVFVTAAVVGGGAVPIGGDEGRAEGEDLHAECSVVCRRELQMLVSSAARWSQVWRARTVWRPRSA